MAVTNPQDIRVANIPPEEPAPTLSDQYEHDSDFSTFDQDQVSTPVAPGTEPSVASTPPAAPSAPPKTPRKHPPGLVRRALRHGAAQDEIDACTTLDLDDWVEKQDLVIERERENNLRFNRGTPAPAEPKPAPEPEEDFGVSKEELAEIHPSIVKMMSALKKENAELKKGLTETVARDQDRERRSKEEIYDSAFESLGEKYIKIFGEGTGGDLKGTDELQSRIAVLSAANISSADTPGQIKKKITTAANKLYGRILAPEATADSAGAYDETPTEPQVPRQPNGKPRITKEQYENGALARTTQRTRKEAPSKGKAVRAVAEKMREMNVSDGDFDHFEEDGLPG